MQALAHPQDCVFSAFISVSQARVLCRLFGLQSWSKPFSNSFGIRGA